MEKRKILKLVVSFAIFSLLLGVLFLISERGTSNFETKSGELLSVVIPDFAKTIGFENIIVDPAVPAECEWWVEEPFIIDEQRMSKREAFKYFVRMYDFEAKFEEI